MSINDEMLSIDDYKILRYIDKSNSVSKEQILKKFKKIAAIEYRLKIDRSVFCRS